MSKDQKQKSPSPQPQKKPPAPHQPVLLDDNPNNKPVKNPYLWVGLVVFVLLLSLWKMYMAPPVPLENPPQGQAATQAAPSQGSGHTMRGGIRDQGL